MNRMSVFVFSFKLDKDGYMIYLEDIGRQPSGDEKIGHEYIYYSKRSKYVYYCLR